MTVQPGKMSEIMKEMSEICFRNPRQIPSSEAAHVLCSSPTSLGTRVSDSVMPGKATATSGKRSKPRIPELWNEFKSNDIDAMIDELAEYKKQHYPDDRRRILTCGIPDGKIRVEWLPAAAPGVDSQWEMQFYGLVRTGKREQAIQPAASKTRRAPTDEGLFGAIRVMLGPQHMPQAIEQLGRLGRLRIDCNVV